MQIDYWAVGLFWRPRVAKIS